MNLARGESAEVASSSSMRLSPTGTMASRTFACSRERTAIPRWSMVNISSGFAQFADDLLHDRVGIALVLGNFRGVAGHGAIGHGNAQPLQQRIAQHLHQAVAPVFGALASRQVLTLEEIAVGLDGSGEFADSLAFGRNRLNDGR